MNAANLFFESIARSLSGKDKGGDPYALGFDCGMSGANTTNCSFSIFRSKEATRAWERGKRDAEARKAQSVELAEKSDEAAGVSSLQS